MNFKEAATYALSFAIICLALSFGYFTYEVAKVRTQIPEILSLAESTSQKIEPMLEELNEIRHLIPPILDEVAATRELIPKILSEVAATREAIPPVLNEVMETRKSIPPILDEWEKTRKELPAVLKTADNATIAVMQTVNEVNELRPLISKALAEVEMTRNIIPPTLDRVDELIVKAGSVGKEASEGAVSGIFTGIIKAPFKIFSGLGTSPTDKSITGTQDFSKDDLEIANQALFELVSEPAGAQKDWANPNSEMRGTLTLVKASEVDGAQCRTIRNEAWKGSNQVADKKFSICKDENDKWKLQ